jgi:hypothetical protein
VLQWRFQPPLHVEEYPPLARMVSNRAEHEPMIEAVDAAKVIRRTIRRWRLHLQGSLSLADLARPVNLIVRGWINYYGRFYPTKLLRSLDRINEYLMRSAMRKYKRLRRRPGRTANPEVGNAT